MKLTLIALSLLTAPLLGANMVYVTPPDHYAPKIEAAACFIEAEGKILFLQRSEHKSHGGTWGIPGGKLEKGETPLQAVIRETVEETGLELLAEEICFSKTTYIRYPTSDFTYHIFRIKLDRIPQHVKINSESQDFRWMTLQEALELPLIPGEDECIFLTYGDDLDINRPCCDLRGTLN